MLAFHHTEFRGNSVRIVLLIFIFALSNLGHHAIAQPPTNDTDLLNAEQRDARLREQQELEARTNDLQAQQETTRELLDQQDHYLKALRAQIKAIKQANTPTPYTHKDTP